MEKKTFGKYLRQMREQSGKSVSEVSDYLFSIGYDKAKAKTIYGWERGTAFPSADIFLDMCSFYGVADILQAFGFKQNISDLETKQNYEILKKFSALSTESKDRVLNSLNYEFSKSVNNEHSPLDKLKNKVG